MLEHLTQTADAIAALDNATDILPAERKLISQLRDGLVELRKAVNGYLNNTSFWKDTGSVSLVAGRVHGIACKLARAAKRVMPERISVLQFTLLSALKTLASAVQQKPRLPVLNYALLRAEGLHLYITVSNLEGLDCDE